MRTRAVSLRFNGVVTLASLLGQPTHPFNRHRLMPTCVSLLGLDTGRTLSVCLALPMFETDLVICAFISQQGAISQRWGKERCHARNLFDP